MTDPLFVLGSTGLRVEFCTHNGRTMYENIFTIPYTEDVKSWNRYMRNYGVVRT